jgi:hypothetical protein
MASGQQPAPFQSNFPLVGEHRSAVTTTDAIYESFRPLAWRSLLLLSGTVSANDGLLQKLNDGELILLRASLERLTMTEPTNAA